MADVAKWFGEHRPGPIQEQHSEPGPEDPIRVPDHLYRDLAFALTALGDKTIEINMRNGWNGAKPEAWRSQQEGGEYKIPAILALIHSEVSEALEAFRKGDRENFEEEVADVLIRLIDMTHGMEIDLAAATVKKLRRNARRGYRQGGKVV